MITNLLRAAVTVAFTPATAIVDVVMLPSDAYEGKQFAPRTMGLIDRATADVSKVLSPEVEGNEK